jgi:hypothetical protein
MTELPGTRSIADADLDEYTLDLIARAEAGWLPELDHGTTLTGAAAVAAGHRLVADALGGPEILAQILGDNEPAEEMPVPLSAAERRAVAELAQQSGTSEVDIMRQALAEYLGRRHYAA